MWKNVQAILLPTNEKSNICFRKYLFLNKDNIGTYSNVEFKHLYIISLDEEIKEGDWCIQNHYGNLSIVICDAQNKSVVNNKTDELKAFKVIATNDSSLKIIIPRHNDFDSEYTLPNIPQQFIEEWVEQYNHGNVIEKVQVEYGHYKGTPLGIDIEITQPKISKDNLISIKRKEQRSYTREEIKEKLHKMYCDLQIAEKSNIPYFKMENWIQQNL